MPAMAEMPPTAVLNQIYQISRTLYTAILRQIALRIDRHAVRTDFEMQMRPGREAGIAAQADYLALSDILVLLDADGAQMAV